MAISPIHDPVDSVPLDTREILRLLESVPLLGDLATSERAVLAELGQVVRCNGGVQLVGVGEEVHWWYLVLNGRVHISLRAPDGTLPLVREIVAGQSVGLDSVLTGLPSATQVMSAMVCSFVRWSVADLQRLLRGHGPVALQLQATLHEELGRDLRAATVAMAELISQ